jgi:hypothetical protein
MLVREQGKMLRRVLAAQVELAAEQRSIHAAQAELRAELRTELQATLRTELQGMLVALQEGTLLAHTPVSDKGEGGVSDGRGAPLILTTSGHPDPRRRRSPAAKLEGRHGSAKKLLEASEKIPIERPKCGSGFFSRRDSNNAAARTGEEVEEADRGAATSGFSSSTAASASPRGSGFFNRRASPQRDAARDADKAKATVQVEPTQLEGAGLLSPAELSDGGVLSDGGGGGKSDGEAKGGRVEIRRRSSSVKAAARVQGHEPLRSEKHRPKGSWSARNSTSPGRTSATAGAAVHDV